MGLVAFKLYSKREEVYKENIKWNLNGMMTGCLGENT
jgi:hypothetical protein